MFTDEFNTIPISEINEKLGVCLNEVFKDFTGFYYNKEAHVFPDRTGLTYEEAQEIYQRANYLKSLCENIMEFTQLTGRRGF